MLGNLLYISLLLLNAIAILNEERFLARVGWSQTPASHIEGFQGGGGNMMQQQHEGIKGRLVGLIGA
ncbi:hypothetical protein FA09DRAFT_337913, partial [Tilletiopsis washingtonensis]